MFDLRSNNFYFGIKESIQNYLFLFGWAILDSLSFLEIFDETYFSFCWKWFFIFIYCFSWTECKIDWVLFYLRAISLIQEIVKIVVSFLYNLIFFKAALYFCADMFTYLIRFFYDWYFWRINILIYYRTEIKILAERHLKSFM